jgi:hypothetical protein
MIGGGYRGSGHQRAPRPSERSGLMFGSGHQRRPSGRSGLMLGSGHRVSGWVAIGG